MNHTILDCQRKCKNKGKGCNIFQLNHSTKECWLYNLNHGSIEITKDSDSLIGVPNCYDVSKIWQETRLATTTTTTTPATTDSSTSETNLQQLLNNTIVENM
jgi:hypothetical protein